MTDGKAWRLGSALTCLTLLTACAGGGGTPETGAPAADETSIVLSDSGVEVDGQAGCAAAEYVGEDSLLIKELLIHPAAMAGAAAHLLARLPALRCHIRTPAVWEGLPGSYLQPFGMIKWYSRGLQKLWMESPRGYLGLAFD